MSAVEHPPMLRARRLGLITQDEAIVLMRADCHVCKSEGLAARARVLLSSGGREVVATLYQIDNDWLRDG
jgi:thymidine phosphorylase